MEKQNYNCVINAGISPNKAFDAINSVSKWWTEDFSGSSENSGETFTIRFESYGVVKDFKVIEIVSEKKIVWLVTNSCLPWLSNKSEWNGTQIVWEITGLGNSTQISMTHIGLVPEVECYTACEKGWDYYLKQSLLKLLTENEGLPDKIAVTL